MEECGYTSVRNTLAKDGLWRVNGKREVIYARKDLTLAQQLAAASQVSSRTEDIDWEVRQ